MESDTASEGLRVVLDSNVVGAWTFKEPQQLEALRAKEALAAGQITAVIPSLFWAEFQHICGKKRHPGQQGQPPLSRAQVEASYQDARELPFIEVRGVIEQYHDAAWELRLELEVDAYDAYYLALACDLDIDVWTLDRRFRDRVADDQGLHGKVKLIGEDVLC